MNNLLVGFVDAGSDTTLCEILNKEREPVSFQDYEGVVPEPHTKPIILPGCSEGYYDTFD